MDSRLPLLWLKAEQQMQELQKMVQQLVSPESKDVAPLIEGKWGLNGNLLHLSRYARHFQGRVQQILAGEKALDRFVETPDALWEKTIQLHHQQLLDDYLKERSQLIVLLSSLEAKYWALAASHPKLGLLSLVDWWQFFLFHEGHHMYVLFKLFQEKK